MLRFDRGKDHPPPRHRTTWVSCLGTIAAVIGGFLVMGALGVGLAFLLGLFDTVDSPAPEAPAAFEQQDPSVMPEAIASAGIVGEGSTETTFRQPTGQNPSATERAAAGARNLDATAEADLLAARVESDAMPLRNPNSASAPTS